MIPSTAFQMEEIRRRYDFELARDLKKAALAMAAEDIAKEFKKFEKEILENGENE